MQPNRKKKDQSPFWNLTNISRAIAYLAASEGRWDQSFDAFENRIEALSQKGYRWDHAHTLCDWGDALVLRGETPDLEAAQKLYNQALAIYDNLGAAWYGEQVEKRLDLVTKKIFK